MPKIDDFVSSVASAIVSWTQSIKAAADGIVGLDVFKSSVDAAIASWGQKVTDAGVVLADVAVPPPPPGDNPGEEFVGPFSSWVTVSTFQELKEALLASTTTGPPVVYVMAMIDVTETLEVIGRNGGGQRIVGAHPDTAGLRWGGQAGGTLLHLNGVGYGQIARLTLDGNGTCDPLIDQGLDNAGIFDTANEYTDLVLKNAVNAIVAGRFGIGAAESTVIRCKFENISGFGAILKNFNALDWWFRYCRFENVGTGVSNDPGAGNYHVYDSVFIDSVQMDMNYLNTGNFNIRDNYSRNVDDPPNGRKFFEGRYYYTNAAATIEQGNKIDGGSLYQGNMGPHIYLDNVVTKYSPNTQTLRKPDLISLGGAYGVPIVCSSPEGAGRLIELDTATTVPALIEPTLPATPPNRSRQVFEANASDFQAKIDQAAGLNGQRPIVHLAAGSYNISAVVPANCDVQIVGDGMTTTRIDGHLVFQSPSRAILRDLYINPGAGVGVTIENASQGRVYLYKCDLLRSTAADLLMEADALLEAWDTGFGAADSVAIKATSGKVRILGGSGGNNALSFDVSGTADFLARDMWFEGDHIGTFAHVTGSGRFTVEGTRVAFPSAGHDAFVFENYSGLGTVLANSLTTAGVMAEVNIIGGPEVWVAGNTFSKPPNISNEIFHSLNRYDDNTDGSFALPDGPAPADDFVREHLAQSRATHHSVIADLPAGMTDIRMYRVQIETGAIGIHIQA